MKKHKRALSLLLIICIMCCAFFGSLESAHAVLPALLANPYFLGLCGTILCAAGLSFVDTSAMEAAVSSWFGSGMVAQAQQDALESASMDWLAGNISSFAITTDLVDSIKGWLSGVTAAEGGSVSVDNWVSYETSSISDGFVFCSLPISTFLYENVPSSSFDINDTDLYTFCFSDFGFSLINFDSSGTYKYKPFSILKGQNLSSGSFLTIMPEFYNYYVTCSFSLVDDNYFSLTYKLYCDDSLVHSAGSRFSFADYSTIAVLDGVATIPFDSTWAPDSEDESKALVPGASVKLPKGLVQDGALDSDVIGAMTPESVRAGTSDIPDVIAGTGTITGTGEGTGIFEGIGNLVLNIPLVGTIASTLSGILEAIRGFFDVSKFDLNFDSLKIGLTKVFPFCIPFDFFNAIKMFSSDASAFVFDINLETEYFTIDHTVDLTPFRLPILFFRYVVVFWFGFILISRTKDFMKW